MQGAITVRMSETLMRQCAIAATTDGLSVAAWLRQLAASAVDMKDPEPEPPQPRRRSTPKPDPEIRTLVRIADQIADLCQRLALGESQESAQILPIRDPGEPQDWGLDLRVALDRVIDRIERLRRQ